MMQGRVPINTLFYSSYHKNVPVITLFIYSCCLKRILRCFSEHHGSKEWLFYVTVAFLSAGASLAILY